MPKTNKINENKEKGLFCSQSHSLRNLKHWKAMGFQCLSGTTLQTLKLAVIPSSSSSSSSSRFVLGPLSRIQLHYRRTSVNGPPFSLILRALSAPAAQATPATTATTTTTTSDEKGTSSSFSFCFLWYSFSFVSKQAACYFNKT